MIELNGTTIYSISCRTTDLNATTDLFYGGAKIPVGGRVTLVKQVFTIHGILLSDHGSYRCEARNSLGAIITRTVLTIVSKGMLRTICNVNIFIPLTLWEV